MKKWKKSIKMKTMIKLAKEHGLSFSKLTDDVIVFHSGMMKDVISLSDKMYKLGYVSVLITPTKMEIKII